MPKQLGFLHLHSLFTHVATRKMVPSPLCTPPRLQGMGSLKRPLQTVSGAMLWPVTVMRINLHLRRMISYQVSLAKLFFNKCLQGQLFFSKQALQHNSIARKLLFGTWRQLAIASSTLSFPTSLPHKWYKSFQPPHPVLTCFDKANQHTIFWRGGV